MSKFVDVNEKYNKTTGTVTKVYKCWWIKVNQKAVRMHALDGAAFPHIITVEYQAYGEKYTKNVAGTSYHLSGGRKHNPGILRKR